MDLLNNEYDLYRSIGEIYNKTENYKQGKYFLERYVRLKDSLETVKKKEGDLIISQLMRAEKEEQESIRKGDLKKSALIITVILILLVVLFYYYKKSQYKNKKITAKSEELLQEKREITIQKNEETNQLKQKVNESFEEVIQLAKDNSVTRFKEVYPEFINRLLAINPAFRVSELTLCAYIFLGFNSKDIALYTFKSVHTVRSRKYNLRKKLGILPEDDIELYFKNLS